MRHRLRFKQDLLFQERLSSIANTAREMASLLPSGAEKDELLHKVRRADAAAHFNECANSAGLQAAKMRGGKKLIIQAADVSRPRRKPGSRGMAVKSRSATVRQFWLNTNYLISIGTATMGWLWFLGWLAVKLLALATA